MKNLSKVEKKVEWGSFSKFFYIGLKLLVVWKIRNYFSSKIYSMVSPRTELLQLFFLLRQKQKFQRISKRIVLKIVDVKLEMFISVLKQNWLLNELDSEIMTILQIQKRYPKQGNHFRLPSRTVDFVPIWTYFSAIGLEYGSYLPTKSQPLATPMMLFISTDQKASEHLSKMPSNDREYNSSSFNRHTEWSHTHLKQVWTNSVHPCPVKTLNEENVKKW